MTTFVRRGKVKGFAPVIGLDYHEDMKDFMESIRRPISEKNPTFTASKTAEAIVGDRKSLRLRTSERRHFHEESVHLGGGIPEIDIVEKTAYVIVPVDGGCYSLSLTAAEPDFSEAMPEFDAFVASFKLKEPAKKPAPAKK